MSQYNIQCNHITHLTPSNIVTALLNHAVKWYAKRRLRSVDISARWNGRLNKSKFKKKRIWERSVSYEHVYILITLSGSHIRSAFRCFQMKSIYFKLLSASLPFRPSIWWLLISFSSHLVLWRHEANNWNTNQQFICTGLYSGHNTGLASVVRYYPRWQTEITKQQKAELNCDDNPVFGDEKSNAFNLRRNMAEKD